MKIIVLVKQVPDVSSMEFDPETRTLKREGVRSEVSAFDVRAVVRAVDLKPETGAEVVVMTMGPPQAREALVQALALGADRGVHLVDRAFAGADTLATARALAAGLRREGFDLVLAGKVSVDAETGQVGPEIAEILDIAQVTGATRVDVQAGAVEVERETDEGFETLRCALPVLVTCGEDVAPEKFAKKADREAAKEKPIETVTAADLGLDLETLGSAGSPTRVEGIELLEEHRTPEMIEGEPEAAAEILANRIRAMLAKPRGTGGTTHTLPAPGRETSGSILVVAETFRGSIRPVTAELLTKAGELGSQNGCEVVALTVGSDASRHAAALAAAGAERVLVADDPGLEDYTTEPWVEVLVRAIESLKPWAVVMPSSVLGRDLAPRVAARLGLGLTGDAIDLTIGEGGALVQWKPAFGGTIVAPILSSTSPAMATVRPGLLHAAPRDESRQLDSSQIVRVDTTDLPKPRATRIAQREAAGLERAAALDDARVAIGVGMGVGGPAGLEQIDALAAALGGAAIATTRDVADEGWLPRQHQVGLTGRAIAPELYLAIGIRGTFEHVVGLRKAHTIVAINKNPKAPIFKHADLGLVGEWEVVLPALIRALGSTA